MSEVKGQWSGDEGQRPKGQRSNLGFEVKIKCFWFQGLDVKDSGQESKDKIQRSRSKGQMSNLGCGTKYQSFGFQK